MRQIVMERATRLEPLARVLWDQHRSWYWLSKQIGISRQRLQSFKDGVGLPPPGFFEAAAAALGVSVEQVDGQYAQRREHEMERSA